MTEDGEEYHYPRPEAEEPLSSMFHNSLRCNVLRTWPTLYDGNRVATWTAYLVEAAKIDRHLDLRL